MSLKLKILVTALMALALAACAKNSETHAPVCPYGQALAYTNAGYTCDFVSLVPPGFNTLQTQNAQMPMPGAVLTPPVQSCGSDPNQTLVNWMGTWLCYYTAEIYPSGGNSPQSLTPPAGQGGEFCTSAGMTGYAYPYGMTPGMSNPYSYMSNMMVQCSPGFQCQASVGSNQTTAYGAYGLGFGYGQAGTCVYTGYHGSF